MTHTNEPKKMRIENRDQLIYTLTVASELEHGLCLQYLFAAFSLKQELSEGGLTWEQLNQVRRWRAEIFHVAAQEMLHLTQASNLLTAIGGAPHLQRPNFPQAPWYYPTRLPWELARFSNNSLERFIRYERPKGKDETAHHGPAVDWNDDPDYRAHSTQDGQPETHRHPHAPVLIKSAETIGEIYEAILGGFETLPDLFIGEESSQLTGDLVDFPQLVRVTDRESAKRAILLIIDQGEGTSKDRTDCHYGTFKNIRAQYNALREQDGHFNPVRRVLQNPLARAHSDNGYPRYHVLTDEFAIKVEKLFTEIYEIMVLALFLVLSRTESSPKALRQLSTFALRVMTMVIVPMGDALTHIPAGSEYGQQVAGPSFEYYPDVQLLPHSKAAWRLLQERTRQTAARAEQLSARAGAPVQLGWAARNLVQLFALLERPAD